MRYLIPNFDIISYFCILEINMLKFSLKSEFSRNVLTLATGTTIAQAIGFLIMPFLTRLYTPEDFGIFAIFMSVVSGISVIINGRYDLAILLPKSDNDSYRLVLLSFFICSAISLFSLIVVGVLSLFNLISLWFLLIPVFIFLTGIYQIFVNWKNRKKKYNQISFFRINNSVAINGSTLLFGILKFNSIGLIIGSLTGLVISNFIFLRKEIKQFVRQLRNTKFSYLKLSAYRYRQMPKTNSIQALIDMFQLNGIIYLIPVFFSSTILGLYSFGMRILQAPINLIGSSIAQVFYQRASEIYSANQDIQGMIKETIKKAALIALPIPVILLLVGEDLFAFVFSEKWKIAGLYAKILSPWIYFDFIRMTISQTAIIINKQKQLVYITIIGSVILTVSILYAGIFSENILTGFYMLSVLLSLLNIYIVFWIYKNSKKQIAKII